MTLYKAEGDALMVEQGGEWWYLWGTVKEVLGRQSPTAIPAGDYAYFVTEEPLEEVLIVLEDKLTSAEICGMIEEVLHGDPSDMGLEGEKV